MSTLSDLIARAAADLKDVTHVTWSAEELTGHLRRALREIDLAAPLPAAATLTPAAGGYTLDLASLGDVVDVTDVWYPYDAAGDLPPERPFWQWLTASSLLLELDKPADGIKAARVLYLQPHAIAGLDGALLTTLDRFAESLLVLGATAAAVEQASLARTGAVTIAASTPDQLARWAQARREQFERGLVRLSSRRWRMVDARVPWGEEV